MERRHSAFEGVQWDRPLRHGEVARNWTGLFVTWTFSTASSRLMVFGGMGWSGEVDGAKKGPPGPFGGPGG